AQHRFRAAMLEAVDNMYEAYLSRHTTFRQDRGVISPSTMCEAHSITLTRVQMQVKCQTATAAITRVAQITRIEPITRARRSRIDRQFYRASLANFRLELS